MIPPPHRSTLFPYTTLFRSPHGGVGTHMLKVPRDQLEPHILRVAGIKLPRAASRSLILPAFWLLKNFLAVAYELNEFVNEPMRSEEHTSELQSHSDLVCRLL